MSYDGIVLAGGAARRLGGAHKPALVVRGRRIVDVALDALQGAGTVVVVGPQLPADQAVRWVREDPPGGGPVAALVAGLRATTSDAVVVLAGDLPFVTPDAVRELVAASAGATAAVAVDDSGHDQPLLACYDTRALRAAVPEPAAGTSMRRLLRELATRGPIVRVHLGGTPPVTWDCDTDADLARAQELA